MEAVRETCGNCKFGKIVTGDFTKRVCFGAPPHLVGVPKMGPKGMVMEFSNFRPTLAATEPACAVWKLKLGIAAVEQKAPPDGGVLSEPG
jgi:hypothetical protein